MMGNGLDDNYLLSLLGIFKPRTTSTLQNEQQNEQQQQKVLVYSNLEEINLFGNRLSNNAVQNLLGILYQFPFLQRLYLGYQQQPIPVQTMLLSLNKSKLHTLFNPTIIKDDFIHSIGIKPNNFRLLEIDIIPMMSMMNLIPSTTSPTTAAAVAAATSTGTTTTSNNNDEQNEYLKLRRILTYYTKLNYGGRRILASYVTTRTTTATTTTTGSTANTSTDANSNANANNTDNNYDNADVHADTTTSIIDTDTNKSSSIVVPMGLWPLILERANRIYALPSVSTSSSLMASMASNNDDDANTNTNTTAAAAGAVENDDNINNSNNDYGDNNDTNDDDGFHAGDIIFCLLHGPMIF